MDARQIDIRVPNSSLPQKFPQDDSDEIRIQKNFEWEYIHILDKIPSSDEEISKKAYEIRSLIYYQQFEKALEVSKQLTKEGPKWSTSWILLGNVLWLMSNEGRDKELLKEAYKGYAQAWRICARDPFVLRGLGKIAFAEGKFSDALDRFEQAEKTMALIDESLFIDKDDPTTSEWKEKCNTQLQDPRKDWVKA